MGRKTTLSVAVFISILLVANLMPNACSDQDSMRTFLFLEEKPHYVVGDTVNITGCVFDKGAETDPTSISLKVNSSTTDVPLTKVAGKTGTYEGTYTISKSDAPYGLIDFLFNASISPHNYDAERKVIVVQDEIPSSDFAVRFDIDSDDRTPEPGDTVDITILAEDGGTRVNADIMEIYVEDSLRPYDNPDTGTYTLTHTIPPNIDDNDIITITAHAIYNSKEVYKSRSMYVNFYNVWVHMNTITTTSAQFDIYVTDLKGRPVTGAFVSITSPASIQNSTDSKGRTAFAITYDESDLIFMSGDVTFAVKKQAFKQSFSTGGFAGTTGYPTTAYGFDVFYFAGDENVAPGDTLERHYIAFNDTLVWANSKVYYYAILRSSPGAFQGRIVSRGERTTNESGVFSLSFAIPDEEGILEVHFEAPTDPSTASNDNWQYKEAIDPLTSVSRYGGAALDSTITITNGDFKLGAGTTITAQRQGSAGMDGEITWEVDDPSWYWVAGENIVYASQNGDTFTGDVYVPSFLPENANYTFFVKMEDGEGNRHLNLKSGVTPTGIVEVTDGDEDEELDTVTLVLVIIVFVVIIILLITAFKGEERSKSTELPPETAVEDRTPEREETGDEDRTPPKEAG